MYRVKVPLYYIQSFEMTFFLFQNKNMFMNKL